jgi:hypothetical protein
MYVGGPETIRLYHGRNEPDDLDFGDVSDATYMNVHSFVNYWISPEYFYPVFFCGVLYSFEPE